MQKDTQQDPAMNVEEAQKYLGLGSTETVRRLARQGRLQAIREPGTKSHMRFRVSELNRYLESCGGGAK